jgi:SAM-dependent methyltransferase
MNGTKSLLPAPYIAMLEQDGHHNPPAFAHAASCMFEGVDLEGKRVLEIGSGRGLLAIYMGLRGAEVLSMEPELVGATSGVVLQQRARLAALGMRNVDVVSADFNTWNAGHHRFDLIVSNASINHLYASEHHARYHEPTHDGYLNVARRVRDMLVPGGHFVARDACRYALFTALRPWGIRRPWQPKRSGVDWRHHQNPTTWRGIFRDAGFSTITVSYPVPYRLRAVARIVENPIANFLLQGTFLLRAQR